MMEFINICVTTNQKNKEDVAAIMQMAASGIYIEDYKDMEMTVKEISHIDLIDRELLSKDRDQVKIHIYVSEEEAKEKIDFVQSRLKELDIYSEMDTSGVKEEDWANSWKEFYKPFEIGDKLIIKPEWEEIVNTNGKLVLNIEPGLAFGTGQHETTKMCLELLEGLKLEDKTVLDVGCGSGILSVAALLLGAKNATAIDIDPLAVKIAGQNAALNNLELTVIEGDLLRKLSHEDRFNVVIANIIADAIIDLSPLIKGHLVAEGVFICSGIIDERLKEVLDTLKENGYLIEEIKEEKGWAAILASLGGK